jgi:hypothetical protein
MSLSRSVVSTDDYEDILLNKHTMTTSATLSCMLAVGTAIAEAYRFSCRCCINGVNLALLATQTR